MEHEVSFVVTRGVRQRLFRGGPRDSGTPIVFLHGGAGLSAWTPFMAALAKDHDLVVPEHPGFGESDDPAWIASVADLAYFYLDFLDAFPLPRAHLVANSIGGWIAAELAIRDSSKLASLTLIAPGGLLPEGAAYVDTFAWSPEESVRKLFFDQAIADRMLANPPSEAQRAVQAKNRATVARLGQKTRLANPDLAKWLHRVKTKTLVVWGDHDQVHDVSFGRAWVEALPDARLAIVEGSGHLPHAEKAGGVAAQVLAHLEGRA